MSANEALIHKFYSSFQRLDADGMKACYHADITFSDPVFPGLKGKEVSAMWMMLIESLKKNEAGWKLEFSNVKANDTEGSCRWEAYYIFSLTGRKIHNIIDAKFKFGDGKIIQHTDSFDFYRWTRMTFGTTGVLIGWTSFFRKKLQHKIHHRLGSFMTVK